MTIGQLVTPRFRLTQKIGRGGMGTVWAADDLELGSQVAVKLLDPAYADDERTVARFRQEAQRAARVRHPHITTVFAYGVTERNEPFIVMELLDGETVGTRIKRCGALSFEDVEKIIGQSAKALVAAHRHGIVHRDVKPDNLFIVDLDGEPFIKVVDFGIAKAMEVPPDLTTTNALIGTPAYMSPEQYTNPKDVDWRTDLWALGVVAYETLTGMRPFYGETLIALAMGVNRGHFRPPSSLRHDLPKTVDVWMSKALTVDIEQRFTSAREMADALISLLNPFGIRDRASSIPPPPASGDGDTITISIPGGRRITVNPPVVDISGPDTTTETELRTPIPPTLVPVRRGDHPNLSPFPKERAPMLVLRTFDAPMAARIAAGTNHDQWFVFTEGDRVYFHRAATGNPVYLVVLEPTSNGGKRIAEAWVAANKKTMQNAQLLSRLFDELFGNDQLNPPSSIQFEAAAPARRIWVHEGDLTTLGVDAIVNAADPSLLGGTGLDGAIHRAAGGGLLGECRPLGGCRPGEAKMTKGWSLPVKHVIHTVGPVWNGGTADEQATLAACYANSLELAATKGLRTIAFPSISTGTKGFPLEEAAFIAAKTTLEFLAKKTSVALVIFCTFTPEQTNAARRGLAKAINAGPFT